ncbi:MAG: hypothetical protein AB7L92_06770 [Alphaproteobacteria bacterium]
MPQVTVIREKNKAFSAFATMQEILKKLNHVASDKGNIDIVLEGFNDGESHAVSLLTQISYLMASHNKMHGPNTQHAQPSRMVTTAPGLGEIVIERDEQKKSTRMSFPVHEDANLPVVLMRVFLGNIHEVLVEPVTVKDQTTGKTYRAFVNSTVEDMQMTLNVISAMAHGQGIPQDNIVTMREGLDVNGARFPAVLIEKAAYDKLIVGEGLDGRPR